MNREIKFRAWSRSVNKMISWDEIYKGNYFKDLFFFKYMTNPPTPVLVPMQWTGLKDKNGIDIYEGDIINGAMYNGSYCYGKVVFHNGQFVAYPIPKFTEGLSEIAYILNQIEVIGNIYQHPELLK